MKFEGRKWDARTWTREQKIQWQEKVFELGYEWLSGTVGVKGLESGFYLTDSEMHLSVSEVPDHRQKLSSGILLTFEDMFPEEKIEVSVEDERGFDNLIYCQPDIPRLNYWFIKLENLSQEQINYIGETFPTDCRWSFGETEDILMHQVKNCDEKYVWTNTLKHCNPIHMYEVSFNDLFKYREDLCSVQ